MEGAFKAKVDAALAEIRTILDTARNPLIAEEVPHRYDDKYALAEFLSISTISSLAAALEVVGLSAKSNFLRLNSLCACACAHRLLFPQILSNCVSGLSSGV